METGWIGLGKMGWNLCLSLLEREIRVAAYNRSKDRTRELAELGAEPAFSLEALAGKLKPPRVVWIMVTAGTAVDETLQGLLPHLSEGDLIVDAGNSHYRDSRRRAETLNRKGILYADVGTSGGIRGARKGACMMVGGPEAAYVRLEPFLKVLCRDGGYGHIGPSGSGHYVKMVHNGIEYGMMQALAEGFELMEAGEFDVDFKALSDIWNHGSIIEGYLMEALNQTFESFGDLSDVRGIVDASGEGRWTLEEALDKGVPTPVIGLSLMARYRSRKRETYGDRLLAALRNTFGGHPYHEK